MEHFTKLNKINVNEKIKKKGKLNYLSWTWAWAEVKKIYPNAAYEIKQFENGLPYVYDENTGYMVFTTVTIEEMTHQMWLPVMDGSNKAMKNQSYEYTTKYSTNIVEAATMFDINKTIMRCLTKNLAMFGLGLYIYTGEDLPDNEKIKKPDKNKKQEITEYITFQQKKQLQEKLNGAKYAKIMNENGGKITIDLFNEIMEEN